MIIVLPTQPPRGESSYYMETVNGIGAIVIQLLHEGDPSRGELILVNVMRSSGAPSAPHVERYAFLLRNSALWFYNAGQARYCPGWQLRRSSQRGVQAVYLTMPNYPRPSRLDFQGGLPAYRELISAFTKDSAPIPTGPTLDAQATLYQCPPPAPIWHHFVRAALVRINSRSYLTRWDRAGQRSDFGEWP
jgi:hypothetical protein